LIYLILATANFPVLVSGQTINMGRTYTGPGAVRYTNEAGTGTVLNKLAKLTGAPSTAIVTATTDVSGILGIVVAGAGAAGSADIAVFGKAFCVFDSATTAGHYVVNDTSTAGDCMDAGATYPTSGQVIGVVTTTNGGAGTYEVDLSLAQRQASLSPLITYIGYGTTCQNTTAGTSFNLPTASGPVAACTAGLANQVLGELQFVDAGARTAYGVFPLSTGWVGNIDLLIRWKTPAVAGSAVWQLQTGCASAGDDVDPAFNAAQTVTSAAGAANVILDATISPVTVTGCLAGDFLFFKLFRDPAHGSDDLNNTASMILAQFAVRRTQ
jgi:hypothetical protein